MNDSPQIQAIKERYKASFGEKKAIVEQIVMDLGSGDDLQPAREELHKLAGSSGMYGYDDIALVCRMAMREIDTKEMDDLKYSLNKLIKLLSS